MSRIAALYWKCNAKKSYISYMIINSKTLHVYLRPKKIDLFEEKKVDFEKKAEKVIDEFFKYIQENNDDNKIIIRYKIYFKPSTAKGYNPDRKTRFIQRKVDEGIKKIKFKGKSQSLRSNLSCEKLEGFKTALFAHVLNGEKRDEYKHRVWAVALLVKKGNYMKVIKSLKEFTPAPRMKKEIEKLPQVKQRHG